MVATISDCAASASVRVASAASSIVAGAMAVAAVTKSDARSAIGARSYNGRAPMSNPAPVRFEGVRKRFGSTEALRGIDLAVASGECLVLLGPSGCGKTTLLRLVAGLETADARPHPHRRRPSTTCRRAERDVAMVFQNYALYPHLTVFENIGVPAARAPHAAGEIEQRVRRGAARARASRRCWTAGPAELSGGQQQRVALGRALVRSPPSS